MTLAFLCSGQGAQRATMFDLFVTLPAVRPILSAASSCLGQDIVSWVREAPAVLLQRNVTAQLLCCTQALAAWTALAPHGGGDVVLAGYSVGELASWGCAGILQPADVLRLSGIRAQAMDAAMLAAADGAETGLLAVRGLARATLNTLCQAHGCEIAIVLTDDHYIVGGTIAALDALNARASTLGAQRTARLPVAIASHTSRLAAASATFLTALEAAAVAAEVPPGVRLLSGIDGDQVSDVRAGLAKLAAQISRTLDWQACLTACAEAGVTRVLELGPGRALAAMASETIPNAHCRSLEDFKTLDGVRAWLHQG